MTRLDQSVGNRTRLIMYGLAWHVNQSDAVAEILIRPLAPWLQVDFLPWDGKAPPPLPPPDIPVCFFEFAPPCQDYGWRNRELTWIPMWDHTASQHQLALWWKYLPEKWRILSFCEAVNERAKSSRTREVLSVRYHRDPATVKPVQWDKPRVLYYWNRVGLVGPRFLRKLCHSLKIETLLFRAETDPDIPPSRRYTLPDRLGRTNVINVPFYKDKSEYLQKTGSAMFVLAPRALEGVGMVTIDALSRGCAVIAADMPTASEYIQHGKNGALIPYICRTESSRASDVTRWIGGGSDYLFSDKQDWQELAALDWPVMGQNASVSSALKAAEWQKSIHGIVDFLGRMPAQKDTAGSGKKNNQIEITNTPLVSICVPHLNSMPYTVDRIQSIRSQTWQNWECIVIDSGSTDGSLAFYEKAAKEDSRIRIFPEPREGIYPAFNAAISRANGEFIYIATADDTLKAEGLEIMVKGLLQFPACGACHTPVTLIDEAGARLPKQKLPPNRYFDNWFDIPHIRRHPHDAILFTMFDCMYTSVTQMLYRIATIKKVGPFPSQYGSVGDFAWHMQMASLVDVLHLPYAVATWRRHANQASQPDDQAGHLRKLSRIVADNLHHIFDNNPSICREISRDDLVYGHRLQALCRATNSAPLYWRRVLAFMSQIGGDPGMIMYLERCTWDAFCSPKFDAMKESRNLTSKLLNRCGIEPVQEMCA
jgi:glycosyltransferase involved in cell wall biosynthesis